MTQSELALRLGVPFPRVNEIIRGRRGITADTALRLEAVLDTPAEDWMAMQSAWELWRAREEARRSATSGPRRGQRRRGGSGRLGMATAIPRPEPTAGAGPDQGSGTEPVARSGLGPDPDAMSEPVPEAGADLEPDPSGAGEAVGGPAAGGEPEAGEGPEAPPFQQLELL